MSNHGSSWIGHDWHVVDQPVLHRLDEPATDLTVPDICVQLQDTRSGHPPCLGGADRVKVEDAIRAAVQADFPGAYLDSACVGAGEPAGESAAFGIWIAPPDPLTEEHKAAMRAALAQPIDRAPSQNIAFFLSHAFIERLAQRAWNELPRVLDDKGIAQLDGYIHLKNLNVYLQPPATVVTTIDGHDERPLPDVPFTIRIDELFEVKGQAVIPTVVPSIEPYPGVNDVLAEALLMVSISVSLWFLPLFALAVYQSVQIRRADAPDRAGVGSAVLQRFMPGSVAVPGGKKRPIVYTGSVQVKHTGVFAGGAVLGEVPRTPSMTLVGPSALKAHKGQGLVQGHFRAEVDDLRGPLTYAWSSDGEVEVDGGSPAKATVRFAPPPPRQGRLSQVGVTITDADGLVVSETRKIAISVVERQGPRGPGGGSGNPQVEP
jgi:hypothetical protein